jgi:hypothetical protein
VRWTGLLPIAALQIQIPLAFSLQKKSMLVGRNQALFILIRLNNAKDAVMHVTNIKPKHNKQPGTSAK